MDPIDGRGEPWQPDRAWADPLIVLLTLLALALSGVVLQRRSTPDPLPRAGIQGRLAELPFAAERVLGAKSTSLLKTPTLEQLSRSLVEPWDRAIAGILAAERNDLPLGRRLARDVDLPGPAAAGFRRSWDRAYEEGLLVSPEERVRVRQALGDGWAAGLLEARLEKRDGRDGNPAIQRATDRLQRRIFVLAILGLCGAAACLAGLGFGIALLVVKRTRPVPQFHAPACSGRALILVFLGWFLGLMLAGACTAPLLHWLPGLRPYMLPINVSLHASWGILLLQRAMGSAWPEFWRGLWTGGWKRPLAWGFGYLVLAVPLVLTVSWIAGPLTRRFPPPQRELLEFLSGLEGAAPLFLTVVTVAILAPLFEEVLFRGAILPAMAQRWGWMPAILGSGLLFGAIHLQPAGLSTLSVLGFVLGAAFRKGGSLLSAFILHALWNGTVFLFLRTMVA